MAPGGEETELVLQAVVIDPRAARVEKAHDYSHYVGIYGKGVRTIKWYVQQGRAAEGGPDLPPLDDPVSMPLWWSRCMKQRCPDSILKAARAACATAAPVQAAPASSETAAAAVPSPRLENSAVASQEQNLQHLKEQLTSAREDQLKAENEDPPNFAAIETKQKKWRELRGEVEKAEEALFKLRSKQGKLVDLEQLGAELLPMLVTTANSIRSLLTRIRPQLAAAASEEERERIWQASVDESFADLIASGFITRNQLALSA